MIMDQILDINGEWKNWEIKPVKGEIRELNYDELNVGVWRYFLVESRKGEHYIFRLRKN